MEKEPTFSITYFSSPELIFEFNKMSSAYKKTFRLVAIISIIAFFGFVMFFYESIKQGEIQWGNILLQGLLGSFVFVYPQFIKRSIKRVFKKDPVSNKPNKLNIYQEHLEVITPLMKSDFEYCNFTKLTVTDTGVFLFLNNNSGVCIPRSALSDEILTLLKQQVCDR